MIQICDTLKCTGCAACMNSCAHKAIRMESDKEGFLRPVIEQDKCVDCELCVNVCPVNTLVEKKYPLQVYSGWSKHDDVRMASSSGGAFTEIARYILNKDGIVFGCVLNDKLQAVHSYVDSIAGLSNLRGSKYVQSVIGDSYIKCKQFLKAGRNVLFSGTPCQISGLRNFLHRDYENLITVDLICHGTPSPLIFEDYKRYIAEEQQFYDITDLKFRCKKSSWIFYNMTISGHVENGYKEKIYIGTYYKDPYIRGFLRDYFLRPSCHQCQYTTTDRVSDFTIADWWGYKKENRDDRNFREKGVSLILANTNAAEKIITSLEMTLRNRNINEAKKTNQSLYKSFDISPQREKFWNYYHSHTFKDVVEKYMMPEHLSFDVALLNKYPNTDIFFNIVRTIRRITRIPHKIIKIIKIYKSK